MKIKLAVAAAVLIALSGCRSNESRRIIDRSYIDPIKEARKELIFFLSRNYTPGGSIAVMLDGKIVWSEGLGQASKDLEVPVTRYTKFRIGSITQAFTALTYEMMVEKGLLNPDSTIQHYLPDFPRRSYKITLADLANHTSGIRPPNPDEKVNRNAHPTIAEGLKEFKNDSLFAPPKYYQVLSKYNYNLLGAIIEKVSGGKFSDAVKKYVTDTLHLDVVPDNPYGVVKGRTNYFDLNIIAQIVNAQFRDFRSCFPSEGLLGSAEDLAKFGNEMISSEYIPEKIRAKIFTPVYLADSTKAPWSEGWYNFTDNNGRKVYASQASVYGGSGTLLIYPKEKLVIAGFGNLNDDLDEFPVFTIAQKFFDYLYPQEKKNEANEKTKEKNKNASEKSPEGKK